MILFRSTDKMHFQPKNPGFLKPPAISSNPIYREISKIEKPLASVDFDTSKITYSYPERKKGGNKTALFLAVVLAGCIAFSKKCRSFLLKPFKGSKS